MPRRLALIVLVFASPPLARAAAEPLEDRVAVLLDGLGAAEPLERLAAEGALSDLAEGPEPDVRRLLELLPESTDAMPADVKAGLSRVRLRAERTLARRATGASTVTLDVAQAPLADVLKDLERQTGNRFRDNRRNFGGEDVDRPVTIQLDNEPFWPAIDKLLDATKLSVYAYGADGELTLVDREPEAAERAGAGSYAGPFRFEPLSLAATRGLRDESASRLDIEVEVAWEPRLRPIAISQPLQAVTVALDGGLALPARTPEQSIDLEATTGEQALRMVLSLNLPSRDAERIESIAGRMMAIIPATKNTFRVAKLGEAKLPVVQEFGDATVTLTKFRKQNEIWELHMRLSLEGAGDALASHRGWVFENKSYLLKPDGERIEHAGFETTLQTESEIGLAYLFDLSGGAIYDFDFEEPAPGEEDAEPETADPKTLTWVYETATGVYTVPVEWEVGPIDLP